MTQVMTQDDRWLARRLPDDYAARSGDSLMRIETIVAENWWGCDGAAMLDLIEQLLPILQQVGAREDIDDAVRDCCERAVARWLAEQ